MKKELYAARCIFDYGVTKKQNNLYEERIILFEAIDFDDAIKIAEKEAEKYAKQNGHEYMNFVDIYHTYLKKIDTTKPNEVFSLIRATTLEPKEYLDHFFDTGKESTKDV